MSTTVSTMVNELQLGVTDAVWAQYAETLGIEGVPLLSVGLDQYGHVIYQVIFGQDQPRWIRRAADDRWRLY